MKAITLTQPWATLVAIGAKQIETRSWSTPYRGPILIHAGKGLGPVGNVTGLNSLCWSEPFRSVLKPGEHDCQPSGWLPLGAIVAVARLVSIHRITAAGVEGFSPQPLAREIAFGDYSPGRFAWLLADVRPLAQPVPCKGALSLWEPPAEVLAAVQAQL